MPREKKAWDGLSQEMQDTIRLVSVWVRDLTDDWAIVKNEIMGECPNEVRKMFSRRDERTKELPPLNEFEERIRAFWEHISGVELVLRPLKERREIGWWDPSMAGELVPGSCRRPYKKLQKGAWKPPREEG